MEIRVWKLEICRARGKSCALREQNNIILATSHTGKYKARVFKYSCLRRTNHLVQYAHFRQALLYRVLEYQWNLREKFSIEIKLICFGILRPEFPSLMKILRTSIELIDW